MSGALIHPTAIVEPDVEIGSGTRVWDSCHLRGPSKIGRDCIIGEKSYIAYGVEIGDRVKLNAFVYVCTAVRIENGVMVSAGVIFTNDRFPRATSTDLSILASSLPDEHTLATTVREGATIGARCVIGPGLEVGRFAMVGMGAVVTRTIPDFHLMVGHPARAVGLVCRCGEPFVRFATNAPPQIDDAACSRCALRYAVRDGTVYELAALVRESA